MQNRNHQSKMRALWHKQSAIPDVTNVVITSWFKIEKKMNNFSVVCVNRKVAVRSNVLHKLLSAKHHVSFL